MGGCARAGSFDLACAPKKHYNDFNRILVSANKHRKNMIVGVLKAQLHLQAIASLKQKRSIVKSLLGRLKSRFNISAAEVDHQDSKLIAVVAISLVSNDTAFIDRQFDIIINFMQKDGRFYLGRIERETFS